MNLEHLRLFCAVVENRSFSSAARSLGVTRSHASQVVSGLEDELGVRLLGRTTRSVTPTREGLSLYERTVGHLKALVDARADIERERSDVAGEVAVTTTSELAEAVLAPIAARFVTAHPHVRLRVLQTWRVVDLVTEGFDFAIRIGKPSDVGLVARPLGHFELGVYASPGYLERRGVSVDDELAGLDWIVARPGHVGGAKLKALLEPGDRGVPNVSARDARIEADSFAFARAVACANGGVATLPAFVAAEDVRAGRLVRLAAQRAIRVPTFLVYASGQKLAGRAAAFRDLALLSREVKP
jgi:LysR family transcriptional regulator for bpeEF and oprC